MVAHVLDSTCRHSARDILLAELMYRGMLKTKTTQARPALYIVTKPPSILRLHEMSSCRGTLMLRYRNSSTIRSQSSGRTGSHDDLNLPSCPRIDGNWARKLRYCCQLWLSWTSQAAPACPGRHTARHEAGRSRELEVLIETTEVKERACGAPPLIRPAYTRDDCFGITDKLQNIKFKLVQMPVYLHTFINLAKYTG